MWREQLCIIAAGPRFPLQVVIWKVPTQCPADLPVAVHAFGQALMTMPAGTWSAMNKTAPTITNNAEYLKARQPGSPESRKLLPQQIMQIRMCLCTSVCIGSATTLWYICLSHVCAQESGESTWISVHQCLCWWSMWGRMRVCCMESTCLYVFNCAFRWWMVIWCSL